jgi:hypothetical protein
MPHAANSEDGASVLILVATSLRRLINNLQNEHGGPRHSFQVIDIVEAQFPSPISGFVERFCSSCQTGMF